MILSYLLEKFPEFRFWQILWFIFSDLKPDRFYEESYDSLEIIKTTLKEIFPDMYNELKNLKIICDD